jgi:hypothetical protein
MIAQFSKQKFLQFRTSAIRNRANTSKGLLTFLTSLLILNLNATVYSVKTYTALTTAISTAVNGDVIYFTDNIVATAQLSITKSLTFRGNGFTLSVPVTGITDAGINSLSPSTFQLLSLNASGQTVIFDTLTIQGGFYAGAGGAITIASGTTAKFIGCTISNTKASSGGGMANYGNCYLSHCHILRNAANFGGGFLNSGGTIFVEYTDIIQNRSLSASGGGGGCENNTAGYLYVNNSTFGSNESTELGGAINNNGAYAYVLNTSFTGNVAYGSYKGGAIAQNASAKTFYLINCLFGYNYYNTTSGTGAYTLNDIEAYSGTVNLYYSTYMGTTTTSGTVTSVVGNNVHSLAADGTTNDLFTGGYLGPITDGNGAVYNSTNSVYRPYLINISGAHVPTLKTASFALSKGCLTGFTNGNGTPIVGYKNMTTLIWADLVSTSSSTHQILDDETAYTRAATPAAGAVDNVVSNYAIFSVNSATNGSVSGASIYGDVYPSGATISIYAIPNTGYALNNWTYTQGGSGNLSGNPLSLTITQNTTLTPNFITSTNYTITYLGNGKTSGTVPSIATYANGTNGSISTNSGALAKTGFTFNGWNSAANKSGTAYATGATYTGNANLILYASWNSTMSVLPITLTGLTAKVDIAGSKVLLNWETESESNSGYFEIQYSENCSNNWSRIGTVNAAGNSSKIVNYSYEDIHPAVGTICYRLREVDKDGNSQYSDVVSIYFSNNNRSLSIFPNPATRNIIVTGNGLDVVDIRIFNYFGQNMTKNCISTKAGNNIYNINVSELLPGIYILKSKSSSKVFIKE